MGPYNAGPNLKPGPLTPALITPVSNCAEYRKVFIFAFNGSIRQKISQKERVHAKDAIYQISRKKITFQKHGITFLKWPLLRRPV